MRPKPALQTRTPRAWMPFCAAMLLLLLSAGCQADEDEIIGSGTIEARSRVIAAESAGRVAAILVETGDSVEADDPLLQLDPAPLDNAIAEAEAALELAEAQADLARIATSAGSPDRIAAEAGVEQASLALDALRLARERLTLRAPTAGRVLYRPAFPGELAQPGVALLRLAELDALEITIYVPEADIDAVEIGQAAEVTVDAFADENEDEDPRTFEAEVIRIAERAEFTPRNVQTRDQRTNLVFAVRLRLDDEDGLLLPGMPAEVMLER